MLEFKKYAIHAANQNSFARIIENDKKYIQLKLVRIQIILKILG